jgi:WD40 repeat protein
VSDAATDIVGEVALAATPTSPILSPDGQYLAALSPYLADVQMYRTSDGAQVWDQPVAYGDMRFSPDGGALLVHEAASLFVVDAATGQGARRPLDQVRDAAVGPGGMPVLIADVSGVYRADDVQAPLSTFPTLPGQGTSIMALAVSPDQRSLAAASDRRVYPATPASPIRAHPEDVLLWNLQDATLTRTFSGFAATSVAFSPDSLRLLIASRYEEPDGRLEEWALDGVAPTWSLTVAGSTVYGASFSPAGHPIAVSFADGVGVLADGAGAGTPTIAREILYPASAFSPDGGRLVTSGITLWKTTDLTPIWTTAALPPAPTDAAIRDNWLAFSPDGSLIVSSESELSDETGTLNRSTTTKLYRADDGVLFRDLGTDFERRAVFSPDGKWLLAADHAWEVATGRQAFMHPDVRPTSISTFLADGRIVLGRTDGVIEIFCPR